MTTEVAVGIAGDASRDVVYRIEGDGSRDIGGGVTAHGSSSSKGVAIEVDEGVPKRAILSTGVPIIGEWSDSVDFIPPFAIEMDLMGMTRSSGVVGSLELL